MVDFSYKNNTSSMVIFKCIGRNKLFLEKVLYPYEVFILLAPEEAQIEIWGIQSFGPTLEKRLRVSSKENIIAA